MRTGDICSAEKRAANRRAQKRDPTDHHHRALGGSLQQVRSR